jgi:hypothetical protein
MNFPVTSWVVMMHHQDAGTFAPAFRTIDEAEEFSNAMRLVTDNIAISEPVPVVATQEIKPQVSIRH